jgi:hypothetical protein
MSAGSTYWLMDTNVTRVSETATPIVEPILLITQFYVSKNPKRQKEIVDCLFMNLNNKWIDKIYLICEKTYNLHEIGVDTHVNSSKITLITINKRMNYFDAFTIVEDYGLNGYVIIANSDIFFDSSLESLYVSNASQEKKIYCQLRFEYTTTKLEQCSLFGPRSDSQDTWIFHSKYNVIKPHRKLFNFELGIPGCDNHITYLLSLLGYKLHNEPYFIRTYHNHASNVRTYNNETKRVINPYIFVKPLLTSAANHDVKWRYNINEENNQLRNYLEEKLKTNQPFLIPRIAGIENNFAYLGVCITNNKITNEQFSYIKNVVSAMKNNAGIKLSSMKSILKYSQMYLEAFNLCDAYFDWDPTGNYIHHIALSHDFITTNFNKKRFWAVSLDIFHNIYNNPWTQALNGKRLLIVSPFIESMKLKVNVLSEIYGVDLFPNCEFSFICPPQTHATSNSEEFDIELEKFMDEIKKIKDTFDIALCSCGGYGNLVCAELYKLDKSAIYVGGVLQMFFGIYGNRWLTERPDVLRLFMNKHWSRPNETEKPQGHKLIENGCYW